MLEATDCHLFSECMRHSSLGVHLLQNISDVTLIPTLTHTLTPTQSHEHIRIHTVQSDEVVDLSGPHDGAPNSEGCVLTRSTIGTGSGAWCEGQHSLFTAQSDLLCAVLRLESGREQQLRGNTVMAVNQLSLFPFPSSSSSSILAVDTLAPLRILSAVAASLHAHTLMLHPASDKSNSVMVSQHVDRKEKKQRAKHFTTHCHPM